MDYVKLNNPSFFRFVIQESTTNLKQFYHYSSFLLVYYCGSSKIIYAQFFGTIFFSFLSI